MTTSTNIWKRNYDYRSTVDNKRHTEAERPEYEKQGRDPDEKWPRGSCDLVPAAFDAFEASKDEVGAGKGHTPACSANAEMRVMCSSVFTKCRARGAPRAPQYSWGISPVTT